jgi:hypothetical protein
MSWLITPQQKNKGLLDEFAGAAAAYSLRDLTFLRGGPVVRVRRSSDNTEQDFTATQVTDGALTTFCGAGDGFVRTWYDQSGNGNHAIQTSVNTQPQIVTNGVVDLFNSKPCLTYVGSGNSNLVLTKRITNVVSVFQVLRMASVGTANLRFLLGDSVSFDYHPGAGSEDRVWISASLSAVSVRNGSNRINSVATNLTTTLISTSQVLISMVHTGTANVGTLTLDRGLAGRSLVGSLQEVLLYNTSQSSSVSLIESDINAHYSIY